MVDRIELSSRHLKPAHCRAPRIAVPVSREFHSVRLYYLQVVPTQLLSYTVSPTSLFETGIRTIDYWVMILLSFVVFLPNIVISDFCFCLHIYAYLIIFGCNG